MKRYPMLFSFLTSVILLVAASSWAWANCDCAKSGCSKPCTKKACVPQCHEEEIEKNYWKCECEEFCVKPPCKQGCKHCEGACERCDCAKGKYHCGHGICEQIRMFVWRSERPAGCPKVYTRKHLYKKVVTKKVPVYKWEVVILCAGCAGGRGTGAGCADGSGVGRGCVGLRENGYANQIPGPIDILPPTSPAASNYKYYSL